MAEYLFTSPDGAKYRVTAPEGATEEQAFQMLQSQLGEGSAGETQVPNDPAAGRKLAARRLGLLTRIPYEVATGTIGAVGDFSAGLMGLATGKYRPSPIGSEAIGKQLDKFLPRPEGFEENAVNFLGQVGLGRLDKAGAAIAKGVGALAPNAPAAFQGSADQIRETAKELHKQGYKILPGEGKGGGTGKFLAGISGEKRIGQQFQIDNQETSNRLAREAVGLSPQLALTYDNLVDRAATLSDIGYDPVKRIPGIGIGSKYRNELRKIAADLATNPSFPADDKQEVLKAVNRNMYDAVDPTTGDPAYGARYLRSWTGADALKRVQELRERASSLYHVPGGDKDIPRALTRIATAIEDQIEFHLKRTGQPGVIQQFRDTRTQLAKNYALRRMLSDQDTGVVDPTKASRLQESGEKLTDELKTLAKAGSPSFRRSAGAPKGDAPAAYDQWEAAMMTAGGLGTMAPGTQIYGPLFAGAVASRPAIRKFVGSKPMQSFMFGDGANVLSPETEMLMKMQAARQFAPLFSQGEE